jgi:hypothetical protein
MPRTASSPLHPRVTHLTAAAAATAAVAATGEAAAAAAVAGEATDQHVGQPASATDAKVLPGQLYRWDAFWMM